MKKKEYFFASAWFVFTINGFQELYSQFKYLLHILFSSYQYARPCVKYQHIENMPFVDEELPLSEKVKTLLRSSPFDGKEKRIEFPRIGNNFEYYSSQSTIFFGGYFWKIGNILLRRISSSREKNNWNIHFGVGNSVCPNRLVKKTYACRHPQMVFKKSHKTTMLHICRLEVKKSCC